MSSSFSAAGIRLRLPFTPANITSPGPAMPLAQCLPFSGATRRVRGYRAWAVGGHHDAQPA